MDFATLQSEVISITNRPDLVNETKTAVKAATLKVHQLEYWDKDILETGVQFPVPDYFQQLDYLDVFPRYRALKYIREFDTTTQPGRAGKVFKILTPDHVFDRYGAELVDICYLAGMNINIKSCTQFQYCLVGIYQNPDITDAGFSSWIAVAHPYAIIYEAARFVFKMIGLDAESAEFGKLVQEQFAAVQISNLQTHGE